MMTLPNNRSLNNGETNNKLGSLVAKQSQTAAKQIAPPSQIKMSSEGVCTWTQDEVKLQVQKEQCRLDFSQAPTFYRRDQTGISKEGVSEDDVHKAACSVFEKYNKANGQRTGFKCDSRKFLWLNDGSNHRRGKFPFIFCDSTSTCHGELNIYRTNDKRCQVEISRTSGDRPTYYKIFDIIWRNLTGTNEDSDVLELLCKDFYPVSSDEECIYSSDDENSEVSQEDADEVRDIILERMQLWVESRYKEQRRSGMVEMIELLDFYPKIFVECYLQDKGSFEKAWCDSYRSESNIAMARCQLMFMEKLAKHASKALVDYMNRQANGVFARIFSSLTNWSPAGRFGQCWIMEDQIIRTILALRGHGYHATLGGGRQIPANYMKKQIEEKYTAEHVADFCVDFEKAVGQQFSKAFQRSLGRVQPHDWQRRL